MTSFIDKPEELLEFINECLKPKDIEKKKFGEVFTPPDLVNEMLDKLSHDVWTNPKLKWLEPGSGMGNFCIIIYQRLIVSLKDKIPNYDKRKKHILEKMLFAVEMNPKNVFTYKKIFDIEDKYKLNIYEGNYLTFNPLEEWGIEKFDIIIGNPPYQQKVGPKNTEPLWNKFVIKSFTMLQIGGYLVFIHPAGWRNIDGRFKNIQKEILSRDLKYLEIHNEKDGIKTFSSETRYDWYVVKNEKVDITNTIIKFQDGVTNTINVNGLEFIPNGEYEKITSMMAKNEEENVNVIYSRSLYGTDKKHMSRTKTEEYKYPCVYTVNSKSEPSFFYSYKQHGHFGTPKLIWSNGGNPGSYVDSNGDYGLTQFAYAIVDKPENLQKIKRIFDSKEFRNLMELSTFGQGHINYKVISIFKKDFWKEFVYEENTGLDKITPPTIKITIPDLRKLAIKHNLSGYSKMKKQELIDFLNDNNVVIE